MLSGLVVGIVATAMMVMVVGSIGLIRTRLHSAGAKTTPGQTLVRFLLCRYVSIAAVVHTR
jgi:multisubunit Na+/H+ antiporter MnhG subunit